MSDNVFVRYLGKIKWPSPNVLLLGAGNKTEVVENFVARTPNVWSIELEEECPIAKLGVDVIKGPRFDSLYFPRFLRKKVEELNIHIVVPFMDSATLVLSQTELPCMRVVSSKEMCEVHNDKIIANEWFQSYGLNVPPYGDDIYRHRHSYGSRKVFLRGDSRLPLDTSDYLAQEFINGREYSIDCYVGLDGLLKVISPRERLYVVGGEVMNSRTVEDKELERLAESIAGLGGFFGPINIQVIRDEEKIYVLEMNLRFPGGAPLTIETGGNLVGCIFNDYYGVPTKRMKIEPNVLMVRAREGYYFRNDKN